MAALVITSGDLNRRIALRTKTQVANAGFGLDDVYGNPDHRWAKHEPIHGLALRAEAQTGEAPTDLFYVRRTAATTPEALNQDIVIDFNGQRYRILDALDVDGQHVFTRISAKCLGAIE